MHQDTRQFIWYRLCEIRWLVQIDHLPILNVILGYSDTSLLVIWACCKNLLRNLIGNKNTLSSMDTRRAANYFVKISCKSCRSLAATLPKAHWSLAKISPKPRQSHRKTFYEACGQLFSRKTNRSYMFSFIRVFATCPDWQQTDFVKTLQMQRKKKPHAKTFLSRS